MNPPSEQMFSPRMVSAAAFPDTHSPLKDGFL